MKRISHIFFISDKTMLTTQCHAVYTVSENWKLGECFKSLAFLEVKKKFGLIKFPRRLNHDGTRHTRSTMARNPQNLKLLSIFSNKLTLPV